MSPLYLYGTEGTGKSHLAHALAAEARRAGIERVVYTSAEAFTNRFTSSIRGRNTAEFKRRFRQECELLVLEDVQFLGGKASTQLELFHTLEHLARSGSRIALTGDRLPHQIPRLDVRLASRMASGLVAELEIPDPELRRQILREKAARGGVRLPEECLERLVDGAARSIRDLEGVLIQLVASASLLKRPIDPTLTEMALRKLVTHSGGRDQLDVETVIEAVASFFGTTRQDLCSRSRRRAVLVPRQLAMYLCRRYTDASLSEIGRALGRDHPAVKNALDAVERGILERAPLRYQLEALVARLESRKRR